MHKKEGGGWNDFMYLDINEGYLSNFLKKHHSWLDVVIPSLHFKVQTILCYI